MGPPTQGFGPGPPTKLLVGGPKRKMTKKSVILLKIHLKIVNFSARFARILLVFLIFAVGGRHFFLDLRPMDSGGWRPIDSGG